MTRVAKPKAGADKHYDHDLVVTESAAWLLDCRLGRRQNLVGVGAYRDRRTEGRSLGRRQPLSPNHIGDVRDHEDDGHRTQLDDRPHQPANPRRPANALAAQLRGVAAAAAAACYAAP